MTTPSRGGARPNSGRPRVENKAKPRTMRLTDEQWLKFKSLGGVAWLKSFLL